MRLRKLSLALLALFGVASGIPAGRAQESPFDPSAFADTTLLRDTLGLTFPRLFWLSDSLRMPPDSLRAISVRYRLELPRLIALADSMHVRVDSVGPVLERERFNPLAVGRAPVAQFSYTTSYSLQQTRSTWQNGSDFNLTRGALFLRNVATVQMDRFESGRRNTQRQTRSATTELGWRLTPDYSLGARAVLNRFDSNDPSAIQRIGEVKDEYQLSVRTRQRPTQGISSEFNLFSGMLDLKNSRQEKQGVTADMNGRVRHVSGDWYLHEVNGSFQGNFARTRVVTTQTREDTRDLLADLKGTLSLFEAAPVGFNSLYSYERTRLRTPDETGAIGHLNTSSASVDATLRAGLGSGGYLNLTNRLSTSDQFTAVGGPSSRRGNGFSADGRYALWGFGLESRFGLDGARTEVTQASATGGYAEDYTSRSLDGVLTRRVMNRLTGRISARIGLLSYRYDVIGDYGTPPINRDHASQSYRIEGVYTFSQDFNSALALDVMRDRLVNLPSASAAANYNKRTYRAEWRWTYRLMKGLTATQRNTVSANYTAYQFLQQNDKLGLDYSTWTNLNAVLNPRLSIDLSHVGRVQPSGGYTLQPDNHYYFLQADESRFFSLTSRIQYAPFSGVSMSFEPSFSSQERDGALDGVAVPQRRSRNLNFQGSASVNLPIARKGLLSGNFGRTYYADRTISFASGLPQPTPRSEVNFWNGSLQFSWRL